MSIKEFPYTFFAFRVPIRWQKPAVFLLNVHGNEVVNHMIICKADKATKEWNGSILFENVDFEIRQGEHIALIGMNGVGKTTFIRGLLGHVAMDGGSIHRGLPLQEWGWMEQHPVVPEHVATLDYVRSGATEWYAAYTKLQQLQQKLQEAEADAGGLESVLEQYSAAYDRFVSLDGYEWEAKTEKCLHRLQLPPEMWTVPFSRLSGGQKTRAQLARLMLKEPKFLLLDEPTNHLDRETLDWLERWVNDYPGTVLIVSHDRYFLDRTAQAIYELDAKGAKRYKGGYSDFKAQRELEIRTREMLYKKQEQERKQLLEAIQRYRQWFQQAHHAAGEQNPFMKKKANKHMTRFKAKEKALERLDASRVEKPRENAQVRVDFGDGDFAARTLVRLENVSFSYGERPLFQDVSLAIDRGDRLAITGRNGAGKTTLLKLIAGLLEPDEGRVHAHPQLAIGYFAQELESLHPQETVLDSVLKLPGMTQSHARTILACFLFRKDDVFKTIGELSMGEKCRVAFVKLYFSGANLLVLDEPTNYLDIGTREKIEEALAEYPGALIVVSHDRYLVKRIAGRIAVLENGTFRLFEGTYDEYAERLNEASLRSAAPDIENEIRRLELQLVRYMSQEEPPDPEDRENLMRAIRETQDRLAGLKQKRG